MVKTDRYISRPKNKFSRSQERLLSNRLPYCVGRMYQLKGNGSLELMATLKKWAFQDEAGAQLVEYYPSMKKPWVWFPALYNLSMVVHACKSSTPEEEAGGQEV